MPSTIRPFSAGELPGKLMAERSGVGNEKPGADEPAEVAAGAELAVGAAAGAETGAAALNPLDPGGVDE